VGDLPGKEAIHRFYRTRGIDRATHALRNLATQWAASPIPEIQTLRRTLLRWRHEVLAYFDTGITNGAPRASTARQSSSNAELSAPSEITAFDF
jgi:transposase